MKAPAGSKRRNRLPSYASQEGAPSQGNAGDGSDSGQGNTKGYRGVSYDRARKLWRSFVYHRSKVRPYSHWQAKRKPLTSAFHGGRNHHLGCNDF